VWESLLCLGSDNADDGKNDELFFVIFVFL
jgi:hypothetical protein